MKLIVNEKNLQSSFVIKMLAMFTNPLTLFWTGSEIPYN